MLWISTCICHVLKFYICFNSQNFKRCENWTFFLGMYCKVISKIFCCWDLLLVHKFKQLERRSLKKKKIRASTGFEPMTSALPVRCSTNWAMKPHIGSKVNLLSSSLSSTTAVQKWIISYTSQYINCWYELQLEPLLTSGKIDETSASSKPKNVVGHCDENITFLFVMTLTLWA